MALTWGTAKRGPACYASRGGVCIWSNGQFGGQWQSTNGTTSQSTGKFVVEFYMSSWDSNNNGQVIGFGNASINTSSYVGSDSNSFGLQVKSGWIGVSGSPSWAPGGSGSDYSGFVVQFAIDIANSLVWARTDRNTLWNDSGTADPATGIGGVTFTTTGPLFPAGAIWNGSQQTISINGGAFPFSLSVPSGFSDWDSGAVSNDTTLQGSSPSEFQWGFGGPEITTSNNNLTASIATGSDWETIFSSSANYAGQHYIEFTLNALPSPFNTQMIGVGTYGYQAPNSYLGNILWSVGFQTGSTGAFWYYDSNAGEGKNNEFWTGSVNAGDVLSLHVDCNKGLIWIKNVTQGGDYNSSASADPAQGIFGYGIGGFSGINFAWSGDATSGTATATVNTGATSFSGTPASGYTAWDANATASAAPRLDGMISGTVGNGNTSKALSLTTLDSNDIILVLVSSSNNNSTVPITSLVSSVTGAGLTFVNRLQESGRNTGGGLGPNATSIEIWWALASSPLSTESITVTLAASTTGCVIYMCGVSGANTTAPFDTSGSLPAFEASGTNVTISTLAPNTLLFFMSAIQGNASGSGIEDIAPTDAFQPIGEILDDNGTVFFPFFGPFAAAQHSQAFGNSQGLGLDWPVMAMDAIQPPYSGTAPSVNGTPQTGSFGFDNSSHSITLSTSTSGIVVCFVTVETASGSSVSHIVQSVSGASLTWKRRWQQIIKLSGDDLRDQEVWWASSSGAISSQSITVTLDGAADGATMVVFGVENCTGWDPNLELPQTAITTSPMTYSTDNDLSLVLTFENSGSTGSTPTGAGGGPSTISTVATVRDTSGFGNSFAGVYSGTQSVPIFEGTMAMPSGYAGIVDVLTNNSATPYNAPTMDGFNYGIIGNSVGSLSMNLTTTGAGEVVVLVLTQNNSGSGVSSTVSSVSGGGLSFSKRGQVTEKGSSGSGIQINCEEWVAYSSGALAAQSITVTLANSSIDGGAMAVLGITGVGTPVQFDPNGSVPAFENTGDNVTGISTDNQYDLLIWWSSSGVNVGQSGYPSGFTQLTTASYNGGFAGIGFAVSIERVNATLSSATITAGSVGSDVINMVDALQFTPPPPFIPGAVASIARALRIR
jgi:hypothetical protein